jgi:MmyB-like transcription regulator ligand binding domain
MVPPSLTRPAQAARAAEHPARPRGAHRRGGVRADFRTRWAAHNVRVWDTGTKEFHHRVVGDLTLTYDGMEVAADPGQVLTIWTAEPGSKSAEALSLLGGWAATPRQPDLHDAPDRP